MNANRPTTAQSFSFIILSKRYAQFSKIKFQSGSTLIRVPVFCFLDKAVSKWNIIDLATKTLRH